MKHRNFEIKSLEMTAGVLPARNERDIRMHLPRLKQLRALGLTISLATL